MIRRFQVWSRTVKQYVETETHTLRLSFIPNGEHWSRHNDFDFQVPPELDIKAGDIVTLELKVE